MKKDTFPKLQKLLIIKEKKKINQLLSLLNDR